MELVKPTAQQLERDNERLRAEVLRLQGELNALRAQTGVRPAMTVDEVVKAFDRVRLSANDFARAIGVCRTTLDRMIKRGEVVPRLFGAKYFFLAEDVAAVLNGAKPKPLRKVS